MFLDSESQSLKLEEGKEYSLPDWAIFSYAVGINIFEIACKTHMIHPDWLIT